MYHFGLGCIILLICTLKAGVGHDNQNRTPKSFGTHPSKQKEAV
ncbi:hypothetical protein B4088_2471 [Bacillus cereus]|uniref:Uncharacterized protein n=1 Tax=Bacillus cereus TaxID=1396 RepID=A0A164P7A8_BACCE|nr:hypothetical protein B4088_2471 [Bacillus cereus]